MPNVLVTLDGNGLSFVAQLRPVDLMLMMLKVTHLELIERDDHPLWGFAQALGLNGCVALLVHLLSQPREWYMVS